jgi:hypothetical protein
MEQNKKCYEIFLILSRTIWQGSLVLLRFFRVQLGVTIYGRIPKSTIHCLIRQWKVQWKWKNYRVQSNQYDNFTL